MVYFILLYYYNYIYFYFDVWHVRVTLLHSVLVEVFVEFWFEGEFVFNYLQKVFSNFYDWVMEAVYGKFHRESAISFQN